MKSDSTRMAFYIIYATKKAWPPSQSSWGRIPGCASHAFVEDIVSHFLKCLINIQPFFSSFRKPIAITTIPIGKAAIILTLCELFIELCAWIVIFYIAFHLLLIHDDVNVIESKLVAYGYYDNRTDFIMFIYTFHKYTYFLIYYLKRRQTMCYQFFQLVSLKKKIAILLFFQTSITFLHAEIHYKTPWKCPLIV